MPCNSLKVSMDTFSTLLHSHLDIIYAFYGSSFLLLAFVIYLQPRDPEPFELASHLWLVAIFGLVHGLREFYEIWERNLTAANPAVIWLGTTLLCGSYLPLFEFARRAVVTLSPATPGGMTTRFIQFWAYPLMVVLLAVLALTADEAARGLSVASRVLLGLPGALVTGWALGTMLLRSQDVAKKFRLRIAAYSLGIAFASYGVLSGLFISPTLGSLHWLPSSEGFRAVTGIPIQLLRALSILAAAGALTYVVRTLAVTTYHREREASRRAHALAAILEQRVAERTEALKSEIEERRHTEQMLKLSEQKYRQLHESMADAFVRTAMTGEITECNHAYREMLGYTAEELSQMTFTELTPVQWHDTEARIITEEVLPKGASGIYEKEYVRKNGECFPVELRTFLLHDDAGAPAGMWSIVRDITKRKETERTLQMFRSSIDQASDAIFWMTRDARFWYVNAKACQSLGYTREELLRLHLWDIDPTFPMERWRADWERFQASKHNSQDTPYVLETIHHRKDGSTFPVEVTERHLWFGETELHVATVRDITERKQAEEALRDREARLRRAESLAQVGHYAFDADGANPLWSEGLKDIWGIRREADPSLHEFLSQIYAEDRERVIAAALKAAEEKHGFDLEYRLVKLHGEIVTVRSVSEFTAGEQGRSPRFFGTLIDMTKQKETEAQLRESIQEKETLLREIHHRVKNNLQVISSLLYFQAKRITDPTSAQVFLEGQNRLRAMILVHEQLYRAENLSRINFTPYVHSLVHQMYRSYGQLKNRIRLSLNIDQMHLPIEIALPCGMILNELLTNAFKYAFPNERSGMVTVNIRKTGNSMQIQVADDGVGLPNVVDTTKPTSFGMRLIHNLTSQINGILRYEQNNGTVATIEARLPLEETRS